MKKIFITRQIPEIGITILKNKGYEVVVGKWKRPPTKRQIMSALRDSKYDAMLTILTDQIDKEVIDLAKKQGIQIIANFAVGFNNINVPYAITEGITITNTPGHFSDCIAEHAVALILGLTTRMVEGDRYMRKGKYKGWDPMNLIGTDLSGKTLGLIGAGRIGARAAAHLIKGFDMKCMYYDVKRNEALEAELGADKMTFMPTVDEVLKVADIVSIHVPLLPSTTHLMNASRLAMMKRTAYLINTSRGQVIDENALVDALKRNVIAGAGLDVFEFEPKLSKGLSKLENIVLTPHIASARESARTEMATIAAQSIIDVFEGRVPECKVTQEMCK